METKFQTSYIPKKPVEMNPISHSKGSRTSIFMILGTVIFIASLLGVGFTFFWINMLNNEQARLKDDLVKSESLFNNKLIEELKRTDIKINLAKKVLNNHIAVSESLNIVSNLTINGVRFKSFDFTGAAGEENIAKIKLSGVANTFLSLAFQSDVFGGSAGFGTRKILRNPILSEISVLEDDKNIVNFNFSAEIPYQDINYAKIHLDTLRAEGNLTSPTPENLPQATSTNPNQ